MGLINNGIRRAGPSTVVGIGTASLALPSGNAGARRIRYASVEGVSRVIGIPSGYGPPIAWSIPQKGGGAVCRNFGELSSTATAAGGRNITADITATLTTTGTGAAIADATCAMVGTLTTTATSTALATMTCDITATLTATAPRSALANATCSIESDLTFTSTIGALAFISCELLATGGAELTVDEIADAVWSFGTRELTAGAAPSTADIWSYATRALTATGVTAIQDGIATSAEIAALNDITAADVWAAGTRELTAGGVTAIQTGLATAASIAALNDLSAAEVNAEVDTALADYDAPTKAELDAAQASIEANQDVINVGVQKASKLIPHNTDL